MPNTSSPMVELCAHSLELISTLAGILHIMANFPLLGVCQKTNGDDSLKMHTNHHFLLSKPKAQFVTQGKIKLQTKFIPKQTDWLVRQNHKIPTTNYTQVTNFEFVPYGINSFFIPANDNKEYNLQEK
jgi:hypothetical protein